MAKIIDVTNALFDSANTVAKVYDDYTQKQAELSTRTKGYQLQSQITDELNRIKTDSHFENWNTEINQFFERIKGNMSNPDSPYYCRNNLQAQMFDNILEQNYQSVRDHVSGMVIQRQQEKNIVDTENAIEQIFQLYGGQEAVDKANDCLKSLYETNAINLSQYDARKDNIYKRAYEDMHTKLFDGSFSTALEQNKTKEAFWEDIKKSVPRLKATDTYGLEKSIDMTVTDEALKKQAYQYYEARLSDVQNANAGRLSEIVQEMRQQPTAEGKLNVAKKGFDTMDEMLGLNLSTSQRDHYSSIFEFTINGSVKGSGSGSGSSKSDDSFDKFCKAQPDEAVQMLIDHDGLLPYDAAQIVSNRMVKEWFTGNYKENYDKDYDERLKDYNEQYKSTTSAQTVTEAMLNKLVDKYPTAANYLKNNCNNLITDMQKHPDQYGEASAGELADFMRDWVMSAPANATDDDFVSALKGYVNNCYIERCKYIELKNDGKTLKDTFNVNKESDIAKAAKLAAESDFVFTDIQGNDRWAKNKKEALEAPGGIVNVLQNAVAGTLGIPESDYGDIGFYYQRDESGYDKTSKPIITYKDKAYEVIANDDGKSFKVREYAVDENGEMKAIRDLDGKTGGKLKEAARKEEKQAAKQIVADTDKNTAVLKKERETAINKAIEESTSIPKAMKAVGTIEKEEWENIKTVENRTTYLNITERKINSDASKVKKNKMTAAEFKNKYGIDYNEWTKTGERTYHYDLILKS